MDDDAVVIGFSPTVSSVDEDAGNVELTVLVLSGTIADGESVTVVVMTVDGIAVVDEDYTELTDTLTFDADTLMVTVTVMIEDDMLLELDQHFFVELSGNRVSDSASVARVTILDNDVDAGELPDGDDPSSGPGDGEVLFEELRYDVLEGAGSVTLVAILSGAISSSENVSVSVTTIDGSATVAEGDYTETTLTLQFTSTVRRLPVSVSILDDTVVEGDEVFEVKLSGDRVSSVSSVATVTIMDNDEVAPVAIGFSPTAYSVDEDAGNVELTVLVLSGTIADGESVTVVVMTVDGIAVVDEDYTELTDTLTFDADTLMVTVTVMIEDDMLLELDQHFFVELSGNRVSDSASVARVTILDNDVDAGELPDGDDPSSGPGDGEVLFEELRYDVLEGAGSVTLVAILSGAISSSENVSVSVTTIDGSATVAGDDYTETTLTLQFTSTVRRLPVSVSILDDTVVEGDEVFEVKLSGDRVSSVSSVARVTIEDDDAVVIGFSPTVSSVDEDAGSVELTVLVLSGTIADGESVTVVVMTVDGSAVAGEDYTELTETLTFDADTLMVPVTVMIEDDMLLELDQNFFVELSGNRVSDSASVARVTILDNDVDAGELPDGDDPSSGPGEGEVLFEELRYDVLEGAGSVTLVAILSGAISSSENVSVSVTTIDGSATVAEGDYTETTLTLQFTSTVRRLPVSVSILDDTVIEGDEFFDVKLSGDRVSSVSSVARVTIEDDDAVVIGFSPTVSSVDEDAGSVELTVLVLSGTIADGESVTVVVMTVDGSAVVDEDYTELTDTLTFDADTLMVTVTVMIEDDMLLELDQHFFVELSGNRVSDSASVARVTILDNDVDAGELPDGDDPSSGPGDGEVLFEELRYDVLEGAGSVTLVAILSGAISSSENVSVSVTTIDGSATVAEGDYTETTLTLQFTSTVRRLPVSVSILDDTVVEGDEVFEVKLSGDRVSSVSSVATVTIMDNDEVAPVTIGFSPTVYSVDEDAGSVELTVLVLSGTIADGESVTVVVMTVDGSAVAGEDYTELTDTLTFDADTLMVPVTVMIEDDMLLELDQNFFVELSGNRVSDSASVARVTILDNDVDAGELPDGDDPSSGPGEGEVLFEELRYDVLEGAGSVTLVAILSGAISSSENVSVSVTTIDGSATVAEGDYTETTLTLQFTSTVRRLPVSVSILDDTVIEADEFFDVKLSGDRVSSVSSVARVTIEDDDAVVIGFSPTVSSVDEDAGSVELTVLVLSGTIADGESVTVVVMTVDGSAVAGEDYTELTETLTFDADTLMVPVTVMIEDDMLLELDQHFFVELSGNRVSDSASVARVTILDNDVDAGELPDGDDPSSGPGEGEVLFEELRYDVLEGAGSVTLVAILSGAISSSENVSVSVTTIDGSATVAEGDYTETTLTLQFTSTVRRLPVSVSILDDTVVEGDEVFEVKLSGDRVSSVSSVATVTIMDNDEVAPVTIGFSPTVYSVDEDAGSVELTVLVLSGTIADGESVTVVVMTVDGSAVAGEDYTELTDTLTFDADTLMVPVTVMIEDDMLLELDQNFFVELSGNRVSDSASVARVTILDNDVDAGELPDGDDPSSGPGEGEVLFEELRYDVLEGAGSVTLVAILSGAISSSENVSVSVTTIDGSATVAEGDYTETTLTLQFTSTVRRLPVSVSILDDTVIEGDEVFEVKLSGDRVSSVSSVATVTIMDNDEVAPVAIGFSPTAYSVDEDAGSVELTVLVLSGTIADGESVTVVVMTVDGSAVVDEDYTGIESVLTFTSGSTTQTVSVVINGDALVENSEVFTVRLATSNEDVMLSASTASVTITDEAVLSVVGPDSDEVEESATGMNVATFTVSLPDGVTAVEDITLSWSVDCTTGVIGAASAADFADDVCTPDSATILSGATSTNFSITIEDDDRPEGTESFTVSIVTMTAGDFDVTFDDGSDEFEARVSLLDNESVTVSVTSSVSSVREGESFIFRLVLEGGVYEEELILPWRVDFGSDSASASASDFAPDQALSGMVTIPANSLTSAPVTLTVAVDTFVEGDEIFRVIVPIAGRPVSVDFVIESMDFPSDDVTIVDDDADRVLMISITAASVTVSEGSVAVFTVELTGGVTDDDLSVVWSVDCGGGSDVTAEDFVGGCPSGTVTIASGETSATFAVYTNDDSVVERVETFTVTLLTVSPNIGGRITISADSGMASVGIRDTDTGNVVVSFDRGFRSVSGGSGHTCGIREDGLVECWGAISPMPTELVNERFRALNAAGSQTCGIIDGGDNDGKVRCWGAISSTAQLPTELVNVRFRAVNTGEAHSCGIRDGGIDDGKVECWGAFTSGQIGLVTPPPDLTPLANVRFRALSLGEYYSCGIVDGDFIIGDEVIRDGEVECWGTDFAGQSSPTQDVRFRALSSGENHTCGIVDGDFIIGDEVIRDGEVECWGATGADAAGNPDPPPRLAGVRFRALGSGIVHTCGIIDGGIRDGEVECWGSNGNMRSTPPTGLRLLTLGSGRHHNCGVQEDGTVACWGLGDAGQTSPPSFAIPEGDEVSFRASFSGDVTADEDISVEWSVSCEGEITSSDFESGCPSGTATIAAGSGFGRFTIRTNDDIVLENAEEFTVSLINALPSIDGRITISSTRSSVTATITDNDTIDIGFEDLRYDVREDVGSVTLTVSVLSGEIGEGVVVTVDVRSINGRAVGGADYTSVRESLTFSSEVISRTLSVSILEDGVVEGTEEFELRLSGESVSSAAATAEVSIRDIDDGVITVTAVTGTVSEGEAANFRLELTEGSTETGIVVEWSVSCEGDVIGEDFVGGCPSGTATIAAGQTSTIFTITTNSDSVVENDERFTVSITGIEDLITISDSMSTASVTIEDEAVLSVSVPDFVEESVSGMSVARFTVSLGDVTAVSDITLSWSVTCATDVTGVASPADFVDDVCTTENSATILAGETFAVFSFTALDDEMREGTESFTVFDCGGA